MTGKTHQSILVSGGGLLLEAVYVELPAEAVVGPEDPGVEVGVQSCFHADARGKPSPRQVASARKLPAPLCLVATIAEKGGNTKDIFFVFWRESYPTFP